MPFAGEEVRVTSIAQSFSDRDFFEREMILIWRWKKFGRFMTADIVRNAGAHGILPGHDAGAGRRANGTRSVARREAHATTRDAVDTRRLVESFRIVGAD